ncbi:uncharacterized protein BT62DRAFT_1007838 [Guyanagaster necrorhizus]|uniref:Uncharacterized protein n=1 Tax=Guyanagaster necrorhizus TaxID=856835 RepID=A0A9P8AQX7_9AGAR|nr:uncharacterized protein BT62DRAFT_1007838 [Guyanagaster necrorhizus MCA 3950]KAG7444813.1 hypothetical protein BT62DRAFT_1007838 [Guyanagaster necrorhizus MCA 3950]
MVVAAFFLGAMSVSDLTGARSTSLADPNPPPNVPFTPKNGAPSTSANDDETKLKTTPYNFGAASHRAFHMKYERKDYDNFIREDLELRVFIPSDDFLHVILHLPQDWRQDSTISALINKVKVDEQWKALWNDYKAECRMKDKTNLYHPHNSLCNRVLALIKDDSCSGPNIGFYRQDPQPIKWSNTDLKPDAITLLLSLFSSSKNNIEDIKTESPKNNIGWPQLLQWLEFKLSFTTLDNGRYATRALTAGKQKGSDGKAIYATQGSGGCRRGGGTET